MMKKLLKIVFSKGKEMIIHKDEYDTKELRSALRRMERAIKDINKMGLIPFCGMSTNGVNIHKIDDIYNFSNNNVIASLDDVRVEGGDY